jgi:hypothetical protein
MRSFVAATAFAIGCLGCFSLSIAADPAAATAPAPRVRSILWESVSTSKSGLPEVQSREISEALKKTGLAVEETFDLAAVGKAEVAIRELYRQHGATVRVEHAVNQMPPHAVEVRFRMIEVSGGER